ncbi:MAG: hypothetical protein V4596_01800 [Bdellovibrionota bacterium]
MSGRCPNMNHGRMNPPVKFCPSCGESINAQAQRPKCDEFKHKAQRKGRSAFCQDCGKKLM